MTLFTFERLFMDQLELHVRPFDCSLSRLPSVVVH
jgi:hypothetical protein